MLPKRAIVHPSTHNTVLTLVPIVTGVLANIMSETHVNPICHMSCQSPISSPSFVSPSSLSLPHLWRAARGEEMGGAWRSQRRRRSRLRSSTSVSAGLAWRGGNPQLARRPAWSPAPMTRHRGGCPRTVPTSPAQAFGA